MIYVRKYYEIWLNNKRSFDDMRSNFCVIHSPDCPCNGKEVQE